MPTCKELIEFLDEYVSGELPPERRDAFDRHLEKCPSCRAYLASYRETIRAAKAAHAVPIEDIPAEVLTTILATVTDRK
ncbi:MAG: anti-sigma factor family protein [Thermoanaerobaculia bacterium]